MRKNNYAQYDIKCHVIWTTKYRYKLLIGKIAERARELIRQSCNSMEVTIIKGSIGKDYIHLLVSCPPNISISKIVQQLKEKTSIILLKEYKELKKEYLHQYLWSSGYFCKSVGKVTPKLIKEYIESNQDEYEENFKIIW